LIRYQDRELQAGDVVQTRVVAIDRKGLRGESLTKEFIVSSQEFDDSKRERLNVWISLASNLIDWNKAIRQEAVRLNIIDKPKVPENVVDEIAIAINDEATGKTRLDLIFSMIEKSATDSEAAKLELAARAIWRVEDTLAVASLVDEAKRLEFRSITSSSDAVTESIKAEVAHQLTMVITDNLLRMSASIEPIVRQNDPIDWTTFTRYFEVTKEQFEELATVIESSAKLVPDSTRQHNTNLLRWIDDEQRRLTDAIKQGGSESEVREMARHTTSDLVSRRHGGVIDQRISVLQSELLKRLQNVVGWSREPLNEMVKLSDEIAKANAKLNNGNSDEVRAAKEADAALQEKRRTMQTNLVARLKLDGELHRGRPEADQRYVADTHLLERVLNQVGEASFEPADDKRISDVYREISLAYHWLESGHDVLQWGRELRSLADDDRWNANSSAGRIDGPNRIERFMQGMEFASNGLKQTGMPGEQVEPIESLRWNELVNEIRTEITARMWGPKDAISAADKLERHHAKFLIATKPLEAAMITARKKLESYLPSIAELARKTAATLEESKPKQEPKNAAEKEGKREQKKRDVALAQAEQLKESLTDEANTQELMSDEGRRKARNADISLKAIEKRMDELQAAAETAAEADAKTLPEASNALNEQTDKAIRTLEQIAKHFEQEYPDKEIDALIDPNSPDAESPLKELEDELGLTESLDQDFARSNAIAKALQSDPRELLKKLQQELDEIADQTLTEAQRGLEEQSARERDLQLQLERSDPQLGAAKRELEEAIRRSGELTQEVERSLMSAANQAAQSISKLPETSRQRAESANRDLQAATQNIREAFNEANEVGSADNQLMSDLVERSEQVAETLADAVESLQATAQPLEEILKDDDAKLDDKRHSDERRNMENIQRRARDNQVQIARDQQRRTAQRQQRQEQEVRNAKQRLQRENENLRRAEEKQQREPTNNGLANETERLQGEVKNAEAILAAAETTERMAKQASDVSKQRAAEVAKTAIVPLDQSQPAAQLAQMMQQKSSDQLTEVRDALLKVAQTATAADAIQPKSNVVSSATDTQQKVGEEVEEIAEDMARAARHQQRLGDLPLAQAISQASEAVKTIAEGEVAKAGESLQTAKNAMTAADAPTNAGLPESKAAQTALQASQRALAEQAQKLGETNAAMNAQAMADAEAATAAEQSAAEADSARQKAQTLDELDRSISASQKAAQQSEDPSSADSESPPSPSSPPATLSAAARKQAQAMAKKRGKPGEGQAPSEGEGEPSTDATESGDGASAAMADFFNLDDVERSGDEEWGKLRSREAEDVAEERRVEISPEYRKQIEAYFRVIAEKAKQ